MRSDANSIVDYVSRQWFDAAMKKTIETTTEINASAAQIWEILIDTKNYESWNPFLCPVVGTFEKGKRIKVTLNPPESGKFTFKPVVLNAEFPEVRWLGKLLVTGIFDGEHYLKLEEISPGKTVFTQGEAFSGVLVGLMSGTFEKTQRGFEMMNAALKKRAELRSSSSTEETR